MAQTNDEILTYLTQESKKVEIGSRQNSCSSRRSAPRSPHRQTSNKSNKSQYHKPHYRIFAALTALLLLFSTAFIIHQLTKPEILLIPSTSPDTPIYRFASVAGYSTRCSQIGTRFLVDGGSAVDAAIAAQLCSSVVHMQSSGIGGGFFMVIWDAATSKAYTLNAREQTPLSFTFDPLLHNSSSLFYGPFSIAVPGEIAGYWQAHKKFGKLPWARLFEPAIEMCENGFIVSGVLEEAIRNANVAFLRNHPQYQEMYSNLKELLFNPSTGELFIQGDVLYCKRLANTFKKIAQGGASEFYNGTLAQEIIADLNEHGVELNENDLSSYQADWQEPFKLAVKANEPQELTLYSIDVPGSGPLLGLAMKIAENFNFSKADIDKPLTYHRMLEIQKFVYAKRVYLGDPKFYNQLGDLERQIVENLLENMKKAEFGNEIRKKINDSSTLQQYVDAKFEGFWSDFGTAQTSVLAPDGSAVSITSTINMIFGSGLVGKRTGIVFNNEMGEFFTPDSAGSWSSSEPPNTANFPKAGKRPMSSMCPAIFINNSTAAREQVRLVVGAAGGSRILSAVASVSTRVLFFGENIKQAIEAPRFHHQQSPEKLVYEANAPAKLITYLQRLGHTALEPTMPKTRTIVEAVERFADGSIAGVSDHFRKEGLNADGY